MSVSNSAEFHAFSSTDVVAGQEVVVLDTSSVAVLDENLVDAVLDLMTAFTQAQVHVCDAGVQLHGLLQLSAAVLHADQTTHHVVSMYRLSIVYLSQSSQVTKIAQKITSIKSIRLPAWIQCVAMLGLRRLTGCI